MAAVEANAIQELLVRIKALVTGIKTAGDHGRTRLEGIKVKEACDAVPCDQQGNVKAQEWSAISAEDQSKIQDCLIQVRDSLQIAAGLDGPTDPNHIMYSVYASTKAIIGGTVAASLLTILLLVGIILFWNQATGTDFAPKIQDAVAALAQVKAERDALVALDRQEEGRGMPAITPVAAPFGAGEGNVAPGAMTVPQDPEAIKLARARAVEIQRIAIEKAIQQANQKAVAAIEAINGGVAMESSVLVMVILLGALGGSIHLLRSLVTFVGNRQLKRSWLLYYVSTPITGAGLASIVYMLMRVGLLSPQGTSGNGSAISNLNLIAIYAFAALAGLFAGTALDKMAEIFKTVFRSEKPSKDQLTAGTAEVASGTNP